MPPHPTQPPFAPGAQTQPAGQAEPAPPVREGYTTKAQAERHEALWLSLAALHKDTVALGAKKPNTPVSDALRITVGTPEQNSRVLDIVAALAPATGAAA